MWDRHLPSTPERLPAPTGTEIQKIRLLLLLVNPVIGTATTQSIVSDASFQAIDLCAQDCFQTWVAGCWNPLLDIYLQCVAETTPYCTMASNDCYCRADHQPDAVSYLSSCISKSCTIGTAQIDVNSAVAVYEGYCASNGYSATAPASTPAQTTSQGPVATTTVPSVSSSPTQSPVSNDKTISESSIVNNVSPTFSTSPTATQSLQAPSTTGTSSGSPSSGNSGGGSSAADKATIASAVIGPIIGVAALFLAYWAIKDKNRKKLNGWFCHLCGKSDEESRPASIEFTPRISKHRQISPEVNNGAGGSLPWRSR